MPSRSGNVLALEYAAREIHQLPRSPEFARLGAGAIARARQQPIQNVFAEPVNALPRGMLNRIENGLESVSGSDTSKRVEVYTRADDIYVDELGFAGQKPAQFAEGLRNGPVEAASPCQRTRRQGDVLIPQVQVNHPVSGAAEGPIGEQNLTA
jgi:hypothetical protein